MLAQRAAVGVCNRDARVDRARHLGEYTAGLDQASGRNAGLCHKDAVLSQAKDRQTRRSRAARFGLDARVADSRSRVRTHLRAKLETSAV